jgi:hypothetical protein
MCSSLVASSKSQKYAGLLLAPAKNGAIMAGGSRVQPEICHLEHEIENRKAQMTALHNGSLLVEATEARDGKTLNSRKTKLLGPTAIVAT